MDPIIVEFLLEKAEQYERIDFIENDPIGIPHLFTKKEDIEISGFLTSTIAWGQRKTIIRNAKRIMEIMDHDPYEFIIHANSSDLKGCKGFFHRTFNEEDLKFFILRLKEIYTHHGGLEEALRLQNKEQSYKWAISRMRKAFFNNNIPHRSEKHVSNPLKNSAAKRIHMFLRWMVRNNKRGVDFGIWKEHNPGFLSIPLDVHTGNIARELGLLKRKQNDIKSVEELDNVLRSIDKNDPVKFDFALFGVGVNKDISIDKKSLRKEILTIKNQ